MLKTTKTAAATFLLVASIHCVSAAATYQPFAALHPAAVATPVPAATPICPPRVAEIRLPGNAETDFNAVHDFVMPRRTTNDPSAWLPRGLSLLQNRRAKTA